MNAKIAFVSPELFLRRFYLIALIAALLLLCFSGISTFKLYERYVIRFAEANAKSLASALASTEQYRLAEALRKPALNAAEIAFLDDSLKSFLEPYGIVKVKLFSTQKQVVYSTDTQQIGRSALGNRHLQQALDEGNSSLIKYKDLADTGGSESPFAYDVVETYVAMYSAQGHVIGVFEVYQDMALFKRELHSGVSSFLLGLSGVILLVFVVFFWFLRRTAEQMLQQQKQLQQLVIVDPTTHLFNQAEIRRRMEAEWERFFRREAGQNSVGLVLLHVQAKSEQEHDFLPPGDSELLRVVAHRLQGELRVYSEIGRLNDEQIIVVLPEISVQGITSAAERMVKLIEERPFNFQKQSLDVSVRAGSAIATVGDMNIDAVLSRATTALDQS